MLLVPSLYPIGVDICTASSAADDWVRDGIPTGVLHDSLPTGISESPTHEGPQTASSCVGKRSGQQPPRHGGRPRNS
eukprot:2179730-Pyramimonas_sp.AAC.1